MRKYVYLLALIFMVACLVRLYPAMVSGLPFSTDGWSCIRNSELLLQFTPVSLADDSVFDGYNNYWPANSVFGAVLSEVTGLSPVDVMAYGVPLAGALTVPLFFVLMRKVTGNVEVALISSALLATAYPYTLFTAGVTKETFANPIYLTVILVFLMRGSVGKTVLFSLASATLVLTHHLAAFLTVGILAFLTIGLFYTKNRVGASVKWNIFLLSILLAILGGYFGFYANAGLTLTLTSRDLLSVGAYQVLTLALVTFFVFKPDFPSRKTMIVSFIVALASAVLLCLFITQKPLTATAPILPLHYLLYLSPYIILVPLMMFGFGGLHQRRSSLIFPIFWLAPLAGLEFYALFGASPLGLTLVVRLLNFLLLPLCALFGLALYKLHVFSKGVRGNKILGFGLVAVMLATMGVNCYSVYASVSLQEPYMGYFWLYREPEAAASSWVSTHITGQTVAGDAKVAYLLNGYLGVNVDVSGGLRFLGEDGSAPQLLFVYPEMSTNGYVVYGGYALELPSSYQNKLSSLSNVYSNGMVNLYAS